MARGAPERNHRRRGGVRSRTHLALAGLFLALVLATHAMLIAVPPGEAEMALFLPAVEDGLVWGSRAPVLTAYLAGVRQAAGPSPQVRRAAMLTLAGLAMYLFFLLAVELCGSLPGMPAAYSALLLLVSPLIYIQSLLAHPELPAMAALAAALLWFLRERHPWGAGAAVVAAFSLPAGAWVGLALGAVLARERRWRRAAPYLVAGAAGAAYWWQFGGGEGTAGLSNAILHLARQLYFLFVGHGHWIMAIGVAVAWREGFFGRRRWRVTWLATAGFILIQMWPGRGVPERGFLPVLPVLYAACVAGLFVLPGSRRWLGYGALAVLLAAGNFVNPFFWPFAYENNLSFAEDARLRARTARWLQENAAGESVATAGALALALKDPRWGYVEQPQRVFTLPDFGEDAIALAADAAPGVFVLYSHEWDPPGNLLRRREFAWAAGRFLGVRNPLDPARIEPDLGLRRSAFLREGAQWAEIYTRRRADRPPAGAEADSAATR